jgi:formylglycine-generating enzyme required for sulfatase activity
MTGFPTELQDHQSRPATSSWIYRTLTLLCAAIAVTALADFLFYRHAPGISVAIFAMALCVAALVANPVRARFLELFAAFGVLAAALAPAIEDFGPLSLLFAAAGASVFALVATGWQARTAGDRIVDVVLMIVSGPPRLLADLGGAIEEAWRRDIAKHGANWLLAWIVPVGLGGLFLVLFSQANPLIERWLTSVDRPNWKDLDLARPLFWVATVALTWTFLRVRIAGRLTIQHIIEAVEQELSPTDPSAQTPPAAPAPAEGPLFGRTAILRSLVLFNALFAVQSVLDLSYLWGGLALPEGMTYATYAHRGAYPLIVTALLAGGFVLAAMQPGSSIARSGLMRALVFLWIGQNVLLVMSSILRLDLYVEVYSLTELRCAAFVWMLLVAAGLVLIVARIVLERTNRWLVWANAAVLTLTLYVCGLIDFPGTIARFNVLHSREVAGAGQLVDVAYLCQLGPAALPALDMLAKAKANSEGWQPKYNLLACRLSLEGRHTARMADWRAWTFRGYRLKQYFEDSSVIDDYIRRFGDVPIYGAPLNAAQERELKPKDSFKECADCPEMVVVPAGSFTMGSLPGEKGRVSNDESPQHLVTIGRAFAVGKFHVTRDQFASFVQKTGYAASTTCGGGWRDPDFVQEGTHPVVCVNWDDAKAYVDWAAKETGKPYRLLSEAEWEYAARGRTSPGEYPRFWFGDDEREICRYGNFGDRWKFAPCNDGYDHTSPVGHYEPNAFGLYDMAGNAQQWTADCYHHSYDGSPVDGSAWTSESCDYGRVVRGGSWGTVFPRELRAASRGGCACGITVGNADIGFRLARTLTP